MDYPVGSDLVVDVVVVIVGSLCHMRRHLSLSLLFGVSDLDFESGCSDMARFLSKLNSSCKSNKHIPL